MKTKISENGKSSASKLKEALKNMIGIFETTEVWKNIYHMVSSKRKNWQIVLASQMPVDKSTWG